MPSNSDPVLLFTMNQWASAAGGIQTVNRELAAAVARRYPGIRCVCLVMNDTPEETADARQRGVQLIAGDDVTNWGSAMAAKDLDELDPMRVHAVVGHGKFSGPTALVLRRDRFTSAIHVHFVHSSPLDTEHHKEYRNEYVVEREERLAVEVALAKQADLVACIGPRLTRFMRDQLKPLGRRHRAVRIDCGVAIEGGEYVAPEQASVLSLGRTDSIGVKGLDIFARAAGYVLKAWGGNAATRDRPTPHFIVRGAKEHPEELAERLGTIAAPVWPDLHFLVRPYTAVSAELRNDFLQASVFKCSWEAAADAFVNALFPEASRPSPDPALVRPDPTVVLRRHRDALMALPGVLSVGVQQTIVVEVLEGQAPELPNQLDGIDVLVRIGQPLALTAAVSGPAISSGGRLLVGGQAVASVAALVVDENDRTLAITTAHAVSGDAPAKGLAVVADSGERLSASVALIDKRLDLALLSFEVEPSRSRPAVELPEPELSMAVQILAPDGQVSGVISQIDVSIRRPTSPESGAGTFLQDLFTVTAAQGVRGRGRPAPWL